MLQALLRTVTGPDAEGLARAGLPAVNPLCHGLAVAGFPVSGRLVLRLGGSARALVAGRMFGA